MYQITLIYYNLIMEKFSQVAIEKIDNYVYLLIDPENEKVFYVGKGKGNRIFNHLRCAIDTPLETDKLDKIREIQSRGLAVKHVVLRHGLNEKEAFEVEAATIDLIGVEDLTNLINGQHSSLRGIMNVEEIAAEYDAPEIVIKEPALLIIVNRLYKRGIDKDDLYEITRGNWRVGQRRAKAKYAFSVYRGIVRQVYEIQSWSTKVARQKDQKVQNRWRFSGCVAKELQHYVGGSVEKYLNPGSQNPIRYLNCDY